MNELKRSLRKEMLEFRKKLPGSTKDSFSRIIISKIENLSIFQESKNILLYWSMMDEVDTHDLIERWKDRKNIILPVINDNELLLKQYTGKMKKYPGSQFNLFEPADGDNISPDLIDLVIVPGLAFDSDNNRMGYGKGYYDRLLANMHAFKIGVCFDYQKLEHIPYTKNDVKMDLVITN